MIKDHNIWDVLLCDVVENLKDFAFKVLAMRIAEVDAVCCWNTDGIIQNGLLLLGSLFLSEGDFVVKASWNWALTDFSDLIGWDTI